MAAPRQLLLRLWGLGTLGLVLAIAAGAYWWEKELPERLQNALNSNDYEACIRTSEQLAALRWLGDGAPEEQALCRQKRAEQLWTQGDPIAALALQQQLLASGHGDLDGHRETLELWRKDVMNQAVALFRQGELHKALELLEPEGHSRFDQPTRCNADGDLEPQSRTASAGSTGGATLVGALDSLNRLDHPWWQAGLATRERVENAIQASTRLGHQQHPAVHADDQR